MFRVFENKGNSLFIGTQLNLSEIKLVNCVIKISKFSSKNLFNLLGSEISVILSTVPFQFLFEILINFALYISKPHC